MLTVLPNLLCALSLQPFENAIPSTEVLLSFLHLLPSPLGTHLIFPRLRKFAMLQYKDFSEKPIS